jgi:radical SAM superfamily enzyme YgiQ (UPF0313 family)
MKKALLINPPVYDTQYWERWSLPHGLLKVATYLSNNGYEIRLVDSLVGDEKGRVKAKRREMARVGTRERWTPKPWLHRVGYDEKVINCYGKDPEQFRKELQKERKHNPLFAWAPDEVWITSIMSYWWESTRDMIRICKEFYPGAKIRVGGIYPTLDPIHAEQKLELRDPLVIEGKSLRLDDAITMSRDLIVTGEIPDANDLELMLSLYDDCGHPRPNYTILTTSRGCPRDCEYCAAYILSGRKIRSRKAESVLTEISTKYEMGIRDFCFYEDNLLMAKKNFKEILAGIIDQKDKLKGIELHSPEGLEIRLVDKELAEMMRVAGFKRVYLPLESIDYKFIAQWERDFYTLKDFEKAVQIFYEAGFRKPQEINVFVLFGLPGEDLQNVYDTAIYAANRTGSVIPMLFAPVPGTPVFKEFKDYIEEMQFDFHDLNGKLLPFLEYNRRIIKGKYDLKIQDMYDLEAFMFRLNEKIRERTFKPGDSTKVSTAFRKVFTGYTSVYGDRPHTRYEPDAPIDTDISNLITEYHGTGKSLVSI